MGDLLNKDSTMGCPIHGERRPAFICKHLQHGKDLGFNQTEVSPEEDGAFQNAWCDACDKVLREEGEWNDHSEGFAQIIAICEGCFEEIRIRNINNQCRIITLQAIQPRQLASRSHLLIKMLYGI